MKQSQFIPCPPRRWPLLTLVQLGLVLCLLSGCILPIPHTSLRSPEVWGRIVDARTGAPIQRAKVFLVERPHHTTYTDANGRFRMKATRNYHWGYKTPEGHWPDPQDDSVSVIHPDYAPYGFLVGRGGHIGDIPLKTKKQVQSR